MSDEAPPSPYPAPQVREPSQLDEKVDWMAYTHQQLYDMVHTGVDLTTAATVKDSWNTLATTLAEVRENLTQAIEASTGGWEGESAQKTRDALLTVTNWADSTSEHAENVATCINVEIEHVETARKTMPPPPAAAPVPVAVDPAVAAPPAVGDAFGVRSEDAGLVPVTGNPTFAGVDTVAAPAVDTVAAADAGHQQAAAVMAMFQQSSLAVDQTVPQFAPPTNPVVAPVLPGATPTPTPVPTPDPGAPVVTASAAPSTTTTGRGTGVSSPAATRATGGRGGSTGGGDTGGTFAHVPLSGGGGGGGGTGGGGAFGGGGGSSPGLPAAGGSSGVVGSPDNSRSGTQSPGAAAAAQSGRSGAPHGGVLGAAPMAAPMGATASSADERGHQRAGYLEDEDDIFALDRKAAPPVIGQ
ncbi:PPE domain-containing protein [Umezawaea beigongshangensis]|uniref:PPE domain-containing protein n=1 Tax=Umezawaea beigongshangensis TaxID=2780383 RepID=UPI0018F14C33|nr:PPE domain-containing protein [Umezawaea beigongshangensis]